MYTWELQMQNRKSPWECTTASISTIPTKPLAAKNLEGYGEKYITILVHWNNSSCDTEKVAMGLYETLRRARDIQTEDGTIKFFQLLYDSQDIGKDDAGICEWVIEAAVIFEKKREGE